MQRVSFAGNGDSLVGEGVHDKYTHLHVFIRALFFVRVAQGFHAHIAVFLCVVPKTFIFSRVSHVPHIA